MGMFKSNNRVSAALDQLEAAVKEKDGGKAKRIVEDLAKTNPDAAKTIVDNLNAAGIKRLRGQ